jgi:predicted HTH domain antitoxin
MPYRAAQKQQGLYRPVFLLPTFSGLVGKKNTSGGYNISYIPIKGAIMTTITLEIPDDILINFNSIDKVRQTLYENFIIEQRQRGHISLGRAAELLGITYSEFFNLLGQKGRSFINATPAPLDESYQHFQKTMEQAKQ